MLGPLTSPSLMISVRRPPTLTAPSSQRGARDREVLAVLDRKFGVRDVLTQHRHAAFVEQKGDAALLAGGIDPVARAGGLGRGALLAHHGIAAVGITSYFDSSSHCFHARRALFCNRER